MKLTSQSIHQRPTSHCVNTFLNIIIASEAVAQKCSVIKVFLKILQNSQENTCARVSFLIKLQTLLSFIELLQWLIL